MSKAVKNIPDEFWKDVFASDYYKDREYKKIHSLEEYFDKETLDFEKEIATYKPQTIIQEFYDTHYSYVDKIILGSGGDIVCAHCKKVSRAQALVSQPHNITDTRGRYVDTILWCSDCIVAHWDVIAPNGILDGLNCSANAQQRIEYWGLNSDRFVELLSAGSPLPRFAGVANLKCDNCEEQMKHKLNMGKHSFKIKKKHRFIGPLIKYKRDCVKPYLNKFSIGESSG